MSYITSQEMKCTLHWFASWLGSQCEPFQKDLVAKTVLGKLQPLLESLEQIPEILPCISECQLHLRDKWFWGWTEQQHNKFVRQLEVSKPDFVAKFYQAVAATAEECLALKIKDDNQSERSQGHNFTMRTSNMSLKDLEMVSPSADGTR